MRHLEIIKEYLHLTFIFVAEVNIHKSRLRDFDLAVLECEGVVANTFWEEVAGFTGVGCQGFVATVEKVEITIEDQIVKISGSDITGTVNDLLKWRIYTTQIEDMRGEIFLLFLFSGLSVCCSQQKKEQEANVLAGIKDLPTSRARRIGYLISADSLIKQQDHRGAILLLNQSINGLVNDLHFLIGPLLILSSQRRQGSSILQCARIAGRVSWKRRRPNAIGKNLLQIA